MSLFIQSAHLHHTLLVVKDMEGIWCAAVVDSANSCVQPRVAIRTISKSIHVDNSQEASLLLADVFDLVKLGVACSWVVEHQR